MFDNVQESAGLFLKVATDEVSFEEIAKTFTELTGKKAAHVTVSFEEFFARVEPWPGAPANWAGGPNGSRDESTMTFVENFTPWWKYWGRGRAEKRDFALLDRIHPNRIKSLREWMVKHNYDGLNRPVLKGLEDLKSSLAAMQAGEEK